MTDEKLPPPPRGYKLLELGAVTIPVLSCLKCGALVLMHRTHNDWHKKNDKTSLSFKNG